MKKIFILLVTSIILIACNVRKDNNSFMPISSGLDSILDEYIQKKVEKMEITLKLEFWQVFLVDSVFNHDYFAMNDEAEKFRVEKVSNADIYVASQDKWSERMDSSLRKILTDEQWENT